MRFILLYKARFQKLPLALAAIFDLLSGGFACYVGVDPLLPFLAYALGMAALYVGKLWVPLALASLGLSVYGAVMLKGEPGVLLIIAAVFKCVIPFFKNWLIILKSEVRGLERIVDYLRENPQALFVLPFMLLIVLAAVKLALGDLEMADRLAVYAYYQLVGGVLAALVLELKEKRQRAAHSTYDD
jgi:hypothetical protein